MSQHVTKIKQTDAKFFIEYRDDKKISPLCVKLPKIDAHVNSFKETKYMSFEIKKNFNG